MVALQIVSRNDGLVTPPVKIVPTGDSFYNHNITDANKFTYSGTTANRYEQAVIDTVKFLGFMSLKDSDHSVSGHNAVTTRRILKEAIETRKAADTLLASGAVVLMGTWSNGIAVGPGTGFARVSQAAPVAKKSRKANPNSTKAQIAAYSQAHQAESDAHAQEEGASCDWQPAVILGPAYVAPLGNPPGIRFVDGPYTASEFWYISRDCLIERPAQPVTDAPTPIYTPAVGDVVFIVLQHENGTTTDRVIDVQRVGKGIFRGYDRRYNRVRNFATDHCAVLRKWDGQALYDHNGAVAVAAA